MVISLEDLELQKEQIIEKTPFLSDVNTQDLRESNLTLEELSQFIESCWFHDYGEEIRMKYSPSFLEFNSGINENDLVGVVALKKNELVGVELGLKRDLLTDENNSITSYTGTGMSIPLQYRGNRINQILWLEVQKKFIDNNASLGLGWIDERHKWNGSSNKIYTKKSNRVEYSTSIPCYVKSFNEEVSAKLGDLSWIEKMVLKSMNHIFHRKTGSNSKINTGLYEGNYPDKVSKFLEDNQKRYKFRQKFEPDQLEFRYTFKKEGMYGIMLINSVQGEIQGVLCGFSSPIKDSYSYFQVDSLQFGPKMDYPQRKNFLSDCHDILRNDFNCFALVAPSNVSNTNLFQYGYIPFGTQKLIGNCYSNRLNYKDNIHKKLEIDLR